MFVSIKSRQDESAVQLIHCIPTCQTKYKDNQIPKIVYCAITVVVYYSIVTPEMSLNYGLLAILWQTTGDKFEDPVVHAVLSSLMDLEHEMPGSCEVLVGRLLHRLGRYDLHTCCVRFLPFCPLCSSLLCLMIPPFAARKIRRCKVCMRQQCQFLQRNPSLRLSL
jgi:hypothetical protein